MADLRLGMKTVPDNQPVVTDSWKGYRECTKCIQDFLREITAKDSEVWLGDVCLGSPDHAWIRTPLQVDSAESVCRAVERVLGLVAAVKGSLIGTVETSKRVIEDLLGKGADKAALAEVMARIDALEQLRINLAGAASLAPFEYHPAILIRWCEILRQSFVSGDPAVRVEVTTAYVL
jgi:hypothetical protein